MVRCALLLALAACGGAIPPPAPAPANHATGLVVLRDALADALELDVRVFRWGCTVALADGTTFESPDLHVPLGHPVRLVLNDPDVDLDVELDGTQIHLLHAATTQFAFRIDHPADYQWKCPVQEPPPPRSSDPRFAHPTTHAIVGMTLDDFDWYARDARAATNPTTREGKLELGKKLYEKKGCNACHTVDGSARVGPSWAGIWGASVTTADGTTRTVDADYVHESIIHPSAFARPGYPAVMPSWEGNLRPIEIESLTTYIESLK